MVRPFTSHAVARRLSPAQPNPHTLYDIIIVGGGPAGIPAARRTDFHQGTYVVVEKGVLANTIAVHYARGKHVMALPESLALPPDHFSFQAARKKSSDSLRTVSPRIACRYKPRPKSPRWCNTTVSSRYRPTLVPIEPLGWSWPSGEDIIL